MDSELRLNDIADDLLILNKTTIDRLFQLDSCVDCIALYVFYYKTAKWQKTNTVKANDVYVRKCLKWGKNKLTKIKDVLKENGLINIVQRRNNGKIVGWYVEVAYLVAQKKTEDIKVKVEESNNPPEQEVAGARTCSEETNALKEKIKCLEKEIEMLKKNNIEKPSSDTITDKIDYQKIVNRLNELAGTNFRASSKSTQELIRARINEHYTEDDLLLVIEKMCYLWNREPKRGEKDMRPYLRPSTLFRASNFENYLNQPVKEIKPTTKDIKIDISDF